MKFTCEHCKREFESAWSHEEALDESMNVWGLIPKDEQAIICDDCHQAVMAWADAKGII